MHNFSISLNTTLTCFGRSFRPSAGVQDCTNNIRYMSYRLVDCLLAGTRWNVVTSLDETFHLVMELRFISCLLASGELTCMTYTWCCMYSLELLMMDGKTVRNMLEWYSIKSKIVHPDGFTIEIYHDAGPMKVKYFL